MTELPSACIDCGKTFRKWEFWSDEFGRTHLDHRCVPADVTRHQRSQSLARKKYTQQRRYRFTCKVCSKPGLGTHVQTMHTECALEYWKVTDRVRSRERHRRKKAS